MGFHRVLNSTMFIFLEFVQCLERVRSWKRIIQYNIDIYRYIDISIPGKQWAQSDNKENLINFYGFVKISILYDYFQSYVYT
jgi:hypothetical protein